MANAERPFLVTNESPINGKPLLTVWDLETRAAVRQLKGSFSAIKEIKVINLGGDQYLFASSWDNMIYGWNLSREEVWPSRTYRTDQSPQGFGLAHSPQGIELYVAQAPEPSNFRWKESRLESGFYDTFGHMSTILRIDALTGERKEEYECPTVRHIKSVVALPGYVCYQSMVRTVHFLDPDTRKTYVTPGRPPVVIGNQFLLFEYDRSAQRDRIYLYEPCDRLLSNWGTFSDYFDHALPLTNVGTILVSVRQGVGILDMKEGTLRRMPLDARIEGLALLECSEQELVLAMGSPTEQGTGNATGRSITDEYAVFQLDLARRESKKILTFGKELRQIAVFVR